MLSRTTFTDQLVNAQPGQAIIYHTGSLMYDRLRGPMFQTVHGTALAAWEAYEAGLVILTQHKIAPLRYDYLAIKR